MTPVVLAVGTTHPLLAAGLLLDLQTIRRLGARPVAVVAGVSAQSATRVLHRAPLDASAIRAQFAALAGVEVAAVCVGALLDPASVAAVAEELAAYRAPVVADPVLAASGGDPLADDATLEAWRRRLLPRCALVTPNLPEAERLLGRVLDRAALDEAAQAVRALGPAAVLLKGGHLEGEPTDVLATADGTVALHGRRIARELRGTGSLLAAAIATRLACGDALASAVDAGRAFVRARIETGVGFAGMHVAD